jgi:hypothetical protein
MGARSRTPAPGAMITGSLPKPISNIEFLRSLGVACLVLTLSAIILLTGYIIYSPERTKYESVVSSNDITPREIQGSDLMVRLGTGEASGNKEMRLVGLDQGIDNRAILTSRTSLAASDYPFIEYSLSNHHPGEVVYLIWRTAENPEAVASERLHWSGDKATTYNVAKNTLWQGRITEIGFDIYGDLRDQPLIISNLRALPYSAKATVASIWSDWTAFEAWNQTSINYLRGVPKSALLPPTVAMAAWAGLALLLVALFGWLKRAHQPISYAAVVLIPWIALDCLWQVRLNTQLAETKFLFKGKSQQERHLEDVDSHIYSHANYLKKEVLPLAEQRIFLLHDSDGLNKERLKTQYYLLPLNIYNYGRFPRPKATRSGDYILALGRIPGLDYDKRRQLLLWGDNKTLNAERVDQHPRGTLYRVLPKVKP